MSKDFRLFILFFTPKGRDNMGASGVLRRIRCSILQLHVSRLASAAVLTGEIRWIVAKMRMSNQ